MHTVRNRIASRPPTSLSFPTGKLPPGTRPDTAYVQRGSMAVPLLMAEESGLIESRAKRRRNPKGKKARKAAARLVAVREAQAQVEPTTLPRRAEPAALKDKAKPKARVTATRRKAARPEQLPAIPPPPLLEQRLGVRATPALALPSMAEPLVEMKPTRVLSMLATPSPTASPAALILPAAPEPLMDMPAVHIESVPIESGPTESETAEPESAPVRELEPATALTTLADAPPANVALPRARALVPMRRQGLIDVIAFLLRDSGRRLARWSAQREKSRAERDALRAAEARQINLQRELEALDALRRHRG